MDKTCVNGKISIENLKKREIMENEDIFLHEFQSNRRSKSWFNGMLRQVTEMQVT